MTTAYTTLLGLALPVEGELTGTWGTTVNDSITQLLDDAIAGTATESVTSGDWTLTDTGSGAPNQARCAILIATGTPGVSRNIIAPARSKGYFVVNQSDAAVVLKGASTTGISIPTNKSALVVWNGSDFVTAVSPSSSGTVTSVAALTLGTSGTDVSSTVANGTTTPVITLNLPTASATNRGALSSTDWSTFNGKQAALGTASASVSGILSSTDWSTFNGKLATAGGTMTGNLTLDAYTEKVATLATSGTIALNPATGTTLSCAAAGTVTFTDSLSSGQSISLLLTNGSSYTINWPTTTWVTAAGNTAPTLSASNTLVFWKISTTLYGALVGKSA